MPHGTFGATYIGLDGGDDADGDLVLQLEDVVERPVIALGPDVGAGLGLDQLGGDADPLAGLA